jgi:hypothetical protein
VSKLTLDGCREKLEWAKRHLERLTTEYEERNARTDQSFTAHMEKEPAFDGGHNWHVSICDEIVKPPPSYFGLIVGDAVHNMRSALDHLACRLVELEGNEPTNSNAFPIWDQDPTKIRNAKKRQERLALFEQRVSGMSDEHKEAIRILQPYQRPDTPEADKLIVLSALDNLDKHKLILPSLMVFDSADDLTTRLEASQPNVIHTIWNTGAVLAPGVWLSRSRLLNPGFGHLYADVKLRIVFGNTSTSRSQLLEIRSYCVGIIESFGPAFL